MKAVGRARSGDGGQGGREKWRLSQLKEKQAGQRLQDDVNTRGSESKALNVRTSMFSHCVDKRVLRQYSVRK